VSPLPLHAFVYSNGVMRDLGTLGGENSYAFSLNAHGDVVGCSQEPSDVDPQAVIYTADGGLIDLDTLSGGWLSSQAFGINDAIQVVGQSHMFYPGVPGDRWHPFLWHDINGNKTNDGGEMINLGTLGGHYGIALDINEQGTVVGSADITNSPVRIEHAFLVHPENGKWLQDTNYDQRNDFMTDIGSLGGSTISAYSINEQEVVVGAATDSNEVQHAFMWQSGSMTSLNDMAGTSQGWELRNARSVNKYQEIVGYGFVEGMARAYLLSFPFRIFGIEPMGTYTTNLYLSISNQVETQILFQVSGHTLDWSTCRIEDDSNFVYTVECYYPTGQSGWVTVSPTDDWPSSTTSWTNSGVTNKQMELFRIRADPGP
ncbi:MAG: DUF3466 family protein, partial [Spartobacteria bacterium]|nr:DUF3466 family protein [Spartobacteria bacterium]